MTARRELIAAYKHLINTDLPLTYKSPVRYNHCFNRIILDWIFKDCWYNHLDRSATAISQLNDQQISVAVRRMQEWMKNQDVLVYDNNESLKYRKQYEKAKIDFSAYKALE
jgi:hypothetical protein